MYKPTLLFVDLPLDDECPDLKRARVEPERPEDDAASLRPLLPALDFSRPPICLASCVAPWLAPLCARAHPPSSQDPLNFTKGVSFSSDGRRLLVSSDDGRIRVLDVPIDVCSALHTCVQLVSWSSCAP